MNTDVRPPYFLIVLLQQTHHSSPASNNAPHILSSNIACRMILLVILHTKHSSISQRKDQHPYKEVQSPDISGIKESNISKLKLLLKCPLNNQDSS